MARAHGDEVLARLSLGEQTAGLRLRAAGAVAARRQQAKDVVAVARDDVDGRRRRGRLLEPRVDAQQLPQPHDVFVVVVHFEDAFVVRARLAPEVAAAAGLGRRDEVAGREAGEARGVEVGGERHRLRKVGGDGDDGDAEAREDEGGDVVRVVGGLRVAEDGAVRMADEDDAVEGFAWCWSVQCEFIACFGTCGGG